MVLSMISASRLDVRSLALFRILFGALLLFDIYHRTRLGKYDLAWYTQDPPDRSYLDVDSTPHKAPLHRLWFYRGSFMFQVMAFGISAVLSLCYCLGLFCDTWILKLLLFLVQVAQQSRNMELSDGSDSFSRHLLFWSIFLPVSKVWSLDAMVRSNGPSQQATENNKEVTGLACLAITTQVALMYLGTVWHRTFDLYGWSHLNESLWLPPKLTAVYYALSEAFATRGDHWMVQRIVFNKALAQALTLSTIALEAVAPMACFVAGNQRHWFAFLLIGLHVGLLLCMNLPNWQLLGMIVQVLWVPTPVWDSLGFARDAKTPRRAVDEPKKVDGNPGTPKQVKEQRQESTPLLLSPNPVSLAIQVFFFSYMLYNWAGNRQWIPKHDHGDIGEGLRLSQFWVMYGTVGTKTATTQLIGQTADFDRIDLYRYIKSRGRDIREPLPEDLIFFNMTAQYPSPRWERAIHQWASGGKDPYKEKGYRFCRTLCVLLNEDRGGDSPFASVELRYKPLHILPPGFGFRYSEEERGKSLRPTSYIFQECEVPSVSPVPVVSGSKSKKEEL